MIIFAYIIVCTFSAHNYKYKNNAVLNLIPYNQLFNSNFLCMIHTHPQHSLFLSVQDLETHNALQRSLQIIDFNLIGNCYSKINIIHNSHCVCG